MVDAEQKQERNSASAFDNLNSLSDMNEHQDSESATLRLVGGEEIHCGNENALLRTVICQIVQSLESNELPDCSTFPLVLYGDPLCGKSMVAHGLANAWKQHQPKKATYVLTAADLARSLKRTELVDDKDRFTHQLKHAELLVIDDIQQLADRDAVQAWLTNLLDFRHRHSKPVIVTCNLPISKSRLSARLTGRLSNGLSIPIALPFAATRKDVILKSVKVFNLNLLEDDVDRLVQATSGKSVSGIQSVVASVATNANQNTDSTASTTASVDNSVPDLDLDDLIQKIIRSTGRRFGVKVADIRGPSRRKNTVLARATAMFILREVTPLSLVEVGQLFRNRDHSTVLHACDKIRKLVTQDESIRDAISSICKSLNIQMPSTWFELLDAG